MCGPHLPPPSDPLRIPLTMNARSGMKSLIQAAKSKAASGTRDDPMEIESNDGRTSPEVNAEGLNANTGGDISTNAEEPLESSDDSTSEDDEKVRCDLVYEQVSM